ncbi:MAG: hypothetical protein ACRDVO_15780 [Jiangellaceae bacterium]
MAAQRGENDVLGAGRSELASLGDRRFAEPEACSIGVCPIRGTTALNWWLQYRQVGPWRSYAFGEKCFQARNP